MKDPEVRRGDTDTPRHSVKLVISMVRVTLLSVFLLALLAVPQRICHAQESDEALSAADHESDIPEYAGLTPDQLEQNYGKPDRKTAGGPGKETWYYGASILFLTDGHVSAWSDNGELAKRRAEAKFAFKPTATAQEAQPEGWVNAWQEEKKISSEDVIDEILKPTPATK